MDGLSYSMSRLKCTLTADAFLFRALQLGSLLRKANFNPNQPRVPAGNPDGGQWILVGNEPDEDQPPKFPQERPSTTRIINSIARAIARYLEEHPPLAPSTVIAMEVGWLAANVVASIQSYLDGPKSLAELVANAKTPAPGYDIHHIVEQGPARAEGFSQAMIEAPENKVRIPVYKHWQITGWYATKNPEFGGLSPREFLRNERWEAKISVGLKALRDHGVLK